jgi:hypothetical protein
MAMACIWSKGLGIPDFRQADREGWNNAWEAVLMCNVIPPHRFLEVCIARHKTGMTPQERDMSIRHTLARARELYDLQRDLTITATNYLAEGNLESRWLGNTSSVRQVHLLEGMIRVCSMMPDIEGYRLHSPEVTLPFLQQDGGAGFLRLLKAYFITDISRISEKPIFLPYSPWDQVTVKEEREHEARASLETLRNYFICECL